MPVHAHLAGELRHHFGNDHFPVAISGNAKRRCDRIGRRERGLGNNIHADLPAVIVRCQLDRQRDLALCGCFGVDVKDVVNTALHLIVHALLECTLRHLQDARSLGFVIHGCPPLFFT